MSGLVLATQNPVDLDYKALANTGTWFLGRLQTERDKGRLLDGLEGVDASGKSGIDRAELDRLLSGLEKRVFLLHNVHDERPVLFQTRWTMSYLRGPLDRNEIARLTPRTAPDQSAHPPSLAENAHASFGEAGAVGQTATGTEPPSEGRGGSLPVLDPSIQQFFAPGEGSAYAPALLGAVRVTYSDAKLGVDEVRDVVVTTPIGDGVLPVDWDLAEAGGVHGEGSGARRPERTPVRSASVGRNTPEAIRAVAQRLRAVGGAVAERGAAPERAREADLTPE